MPSQTYGRFAAICGLSIKNQIDISSSKTQSFFILKILIKTLNHKGGVIDDDYRGIIKIMMINKRIKNFTIEKRMKIVQLITVKLVYPECWWLIG